MNLRGHFVARKEHVNGREEARGREEEGFALRE